MKAKTLSRREFLRMSAAASAGALFASHVPNGLAAPARAPGMQPVEIVFVTTESSDSSSQLFDPVYQNYREDHPDFTIRWLGVVAEGGWGGYFDKLSVVIAGGEQVDIGKIPTEGMRLAVARGLIRPLDEFIETTEMAYYFDDVSPKLASLFVYGGKTYGLPYDYNNMMIWLNTNRLEEEGLEVPPEDWTFEDFREYANLLTKRDGDNITHFGFSFWTNPFGLCPWLFNNGLDGMMTGDALDTPLMTDPAYVEVIQFLYDLMYVDQVVPRADSTAAANFEDGTVAMMMAGRWTIAPYLESGFEAYEVQYWPKGTRQVTEVGCGNWPIFTSAQHPEAAWDFEAFLLRPENIAYFVSQGANIPSARSIGYSEDFTKLPRNSGRLWYESIDREDIPVMSVTSPPDFSEMEQISERYLSQVFANELGVQEALEATQLEIEQMVARRPAEWASLF